jgi:GAF domain-containing protein
MTMPCEVPTADPAPERAHTPADDAPGRAGGSAAQLLRMVAAGRPQLEILEAVCRSIEDVATDSHCAIYLIDWPGSRIDSFAAPSLPAEFNLALSRLPLRHDAGPCARAACLKVPVVAQDIPSDSLWRDSSFGALAAEHGIRSCWATPLFAGDEHVLGALAVLRADSADPTPPQENLVGSLAGIAAIAVERARLAAALARAGEEIARLAGLLALGTSLAAELIQPITGVSINANAGLRMLAGTIDVDGTRKTLDRTLRDCDRAAAMVATLRGLLGGKDAGGGRPPSNPGGRPHGA